MSREQPAWDAALGRRTGRLYVLIFAALAAGIVSAGYLAYRSYALHFRAGIDHQLAGIVELKANELTQWRIERARDGNLFYKNTAFAGLVRRCFAQPEAAEARAQLLDWLGKVQANGQYDQVRLLDTQGVTRLAVPAVHPPVASLILQRLPEVLRTRELAYQDFYRNEHDQRIYLAVLVPLFDEQAGGRPLGVMLLRIDPEPYLYPFIKRWPTPSPSAETLLVRREGNEVILPDGSRCPLVAALQWRQPEGATQPAAPRPAGSPARGSVPVVAVLRPIPDTPWSLLARVDAAEVYAPLYEQLGLVIGMVAMLLFGAGAGVGLVWRQQRVRFYRERLNASEALRDSEQNYRALFENMRNGFAYCRMLYDAQRRPVDFLYLAVNKAFEQLTGLKNVVGKPISVVIPGIREVSPELFEAYGRVATTGQPESFEFDFKSQRQWLAISVYSPGRGCFVAVFDDITARKQAEAAVRDSQAKLTAALDSMTDAVFISDAEGQFLEFNEAFATFHRFKNKNECAKRLADYPEFLEVYLPDGTLAPLAQWAVPRALRGESATNAEYRLHRKDTGETWFGSYSFAPIRNNAGAIAGSVVVGRDITDRKRAEAELQDSERRLHFALETIKTGAWDLSLLDHTAHRTLFHDQIFGYERLLPAWTYEIFLEHVLPEDRPEVDRKFREATATQSVWNFECRIRRTDGAVRWILAAGDHERNATGQPVRMSGIVQDITARKQAEVELQERNAELERFLYTVSHDLKSPVVTVRTFLGYLEQDLAAANTERTQKDLRYIRSAAEKMAHLLDDVLEISRVGRVVGAPVHVTLHALAEETLQAVAGQIAERGVRVQVGAADLQFFGDRLRLGEIWQNLVENAVKFMGDQAAPLIEIGWEVRGPETVCFVRDNGIGIEPRFQAKVFGLFEKLDPKVAGTGIGLALVKRIVDFYAGRLWVESAGPGQGSCFYFTLPKALPETPKGTKP